ncbi:NUDIX hydrolase [Actinoplanes sp. URMC 104]
MRLALVDIEPPDGHRFEHHVVRLQTVVLTIVLDDQDRVLMMWRYRFATNEWGWEIPGGILEKNEEPSTAAVREVEEETGWRPGRVEHLVSFQPMPGMVDTPHAIYLGRDPKLVGEPSDAEEAAVIDWLPLSDVSELVSKGRVIGSGSLVALLYLLAHRGSPEKR